MIEDVTFQAVDPRTLEVDALLLPVAAGEPLPIDDLLAPLNEALGGELARLAEDAGFEGKRDSTLLIPTLGRASARRLVLVGIGAAEHVNAEFVRRGVGTGVRAARDAGATTVAVGLPPADSWMDGAMGTEAAVEGALLATYRFDRHRGTVHTEPKKEVGAIIVAGEGYDPDQGQTAVARGKARAAAVTLARDLSNEPGSEINPVTFAEQCQAVAETAGLEVTVLTPVEMAEHGMGGILAVGKGSVVEPRMIHLVYRPDDSIEGSGRSVGVVGKCITFDTGGYSIKPYEGMLEMKGDMAGGAAVLGAMSALRAVDCPHTVHAVICAAENMISGEAYRPGDILTAMNGVTIEVLSTDAEGRIVLADGLVYCARQGAEELIDLATLTGAIVVALGDGTAGLFSSDDALADRLLAASHEAGERMWRMPLTAALEENIKGDVGDIKNTGGRWGGAITAALFLQHFREGLAWAHLDIAGCNRATKTSAYTPKGATGYGVRTLLEYLSA